MRSALVVVLLAGLARPAWADNVPPPTVPTRLESAARVTTEGGTVIDLPPKWWIVPPEQFDRIDRELAKLQAENKSLRESVSEGRSTWAWVLGGLAAGFAAGWAVSELK